MKKEAKSDVQAAAEKAESEELRQKVLVSTNTIPAKIRNDGSYQAAVHFKKYAIEARKAAESKQLNQKLRSAWSLISGYYA